MVFGFGMLSIPFGVNPQSGGVVVTIDDPDDDIDYDYLLFVQATGLFDPFEGKKWDGNLSSFYGAVVGLKDGSRPVPIPAAAWLLGSGLFGLVGLRRRQRK